MSDWINWLLMPLLVLVWLWIAAWVMRKIIQLYQMVRSRYLYEKTVRRKKEASDE